MNITLLGNGFDLYFKLPTKYVNFLNTVYYLSSRHMYATKMIGDVFGNKRLQAEDAWIAQSYDEYKEIYDTTPISADEIDKLTALSNNMWFKYLWESLNKDIGWIDFETEIALVVRCFQERFLKSASSRSTFHSPLSAEAEYIIKKFDFFIDETTKQENFSPYGFQETKSMYCVEYPIGSGNMIWDKKKIVSVLSTDLVEFTEGLKTYLDCFVDRILPGLIKQKAIAESDFVRYSDYVVTFNYSSTYERIGLSGNVFHVHGTLDESIVLGINPDVNDAVENVDTTFISFKKYYQRTMIKSDEEYIKWLRQNKGLQEHIHLVIMGHSLDISDKDIIAELFNLANEIVVLYHNEEAKSAYISNLVRIFGSDGFTSLRLEKSLSFVDLYSDYSALIETRKKTCSPELRKVTWLY